MSNPEAINYGRAGYEQKKQATPPPTTPPPANPPPTSATPTPQEPMEVITEEPGPRHSTPIDEAVQGRSRLPSQPQTPVYDVASDREQIASVTSYQGETPRTRKKRSTSEEATPPSREATPTSGMAHNAVPVGKRISRLQLQLMGGEGREELILPPSPAEGDQEMVMSGEVQVSSEEGTKSVKVVDIQHRPADFGLHSLVEWEGQEGGSGSEDEGQGASPSPLKDPSAESKAEEGFSRRRSKAFSGSRSPSSHFATPGEGSLNSSTLSTLHLRKKGQRHLYRSVKVLAPLSVFSEVELKEKKEAKARLFEAQMIQRQMGLLERQYDDLEETGKKLEMALRSEGPGKGWSSGRRGQTCCSHGGRGQTRCSHGGRGQTHYSRGGRGQTHYSHCGEWSDALFPWGLKELDARFLWEGVCYVQWKELDVCVASLPARYGQPPDAAVAGPGA